MSKIDRINDKHLQENEMVIKRFNILMITHSIILGGILNSQNQYTVLIGSLVGIVFCYLWWIILTMTWELSKFWAGAVEYLAGKKSETNIDVSHGTLFNDWYRTGYTYFLGKDIIWWSLSGIILIFFIAYLIISLSTGRGVGAHVPAIILVVALALLTLTVHISWPGQNALEEDGNLNYYYKLTEKIVDDD